MEETKDFQQDYESLNEQYQKSKKKKTTIFLSIALALVLVLSTLIIAFSCVNYSSKPNFVENPSYIEVTVDGTTKTFDGMDEDYEKVLKLYSESFDYSYLTAIFTNSNGYTIKETSDKFYATSSTKTGMNSTLKSKLGSNYIHFHYAQDQTMKTSAGETYYTIKSTTEQIALQFIDLYIKVSTENELADETFYFGTYGLVSDPTITTLTVKANSYALCEYVSQL